MKILLVVDANRAIAAFIRSGTTREILMMEQFEFIAPDFILEEIEKYKAEIMLKAGLGLENFEVLLSLFLGCITILPKEEYQEYIPLLEKEISDIKDIPYIACGLAAKAQGIWTHDPDFREQKKVNVFTNIDLLRMNVASK